MIPRKSKKVEDAYGEVISLDMRLKSLAQIQDHPECINDKREMAKAITVSTTSQAYIEEIKSGGYLPLKKTRFGNRYKIPRRLRDMMEDAEKWTKQYRGLLKALGLKLPEDDMGRKI